MIDFNVIDSSVWIAYLIGDQNASLLIDNESGLATSVLSLFEVHKTLSRLKYSKNIISSSLSLIKQRSVIMDVDEQVTENALDFSTKLATVDAFIYATAKLNNFKLITKDNDFRNLPNVEII